MSDPVGRALAACAERLGDDATRVLARLAGTLGDRAREAKRGLDVQDPALAKHRRAEYAAAARTPLPAGLRAVHPSWIEAALVELPPRARAALAEQGRDPLDVWLARFAAAALPPMPASPRTELEHIVLREPAELVDWLADIGADQLAFALGAERAASRPALAVAGARIAKPPRLGNLGPRRAAIERCTTVCVDDELGALLIVAGRTLAPHLAHDPLAGLQLTRRLPHSLGRLVANELRAHAASPLDRAPAWAALVAP